MTRCQRVRARAGAFSGRCTLELSQMEPPISTLVGQFVGARGGMCGTLTKKWIADRARGRTLGATLFDTRQRGMEIVPWVSLDTIHMVPQEPERELNMSRIANLLMTDLADENYQLTSRFGSRGITKRFWRRVDRSVWFENSVAWLASCGVRLSDEMVRRCSSTRASVEAVNQLIWRDIQPVPGKFVMCTLGGRIGSHVVGFALSQRTPLVLFDPNFGEFEFTTESWGEWMTETLYGLGWRDFGTVAIQIFQGPAA